ncbi:hypothetical protein [Hydrocarboniphaga daqingensis]|nr:hypothetical protein [Hydrocarboniphaga daqingensis]
MIKASENDLRQLNLMTDCVAQFKAGSIPLRQLITTIEALLKMLGSLDQETRKRLREQWEILEQVYSYAQAMRDGRIDADGEKLINRAVTLLDSLLKPWEKEQ